MDEPLPRREQLGQDELDRLLRISEAIPGWTRGDEAAELVRLSFQQGKDATIVEIGSFFGSGSILLAGSRAARGSGKVHCIDPFDCSGDAFSIPHYQRILNDAGGGSLRDHFEENIQRAGFSPWVEVHQGDACTIAANWDVPIDLLYLDGDQSRPGARAGYDSWSPFLKPGGIIAIHNTNPGNHTIGHDGYRHLVETMIHPPLYTDIRRIRATTFATKRTHA